jgi:hypothetical protein
VPGRCLIRRVKREQVSYSSFSPKLRPENLNPRLDACHHHIRRPSKRMQGELNSPWYRQRSILHRRDGETTETIPMHRNEFISDKEIKQQLDPNSLVLTVKVSRCLCVFNAFSGTFTAPWLSLGCYFRGYQLSTTLLDMYQYIVEYTCPRLGVNAPSGINSRTFQQDPPWGEEASRIVLFYWNAWAILCRNRQQEMWALVAIYYLGNLLGGRRSGSTTWKRLFVVEVLRIRIMPWPQAAECNMITNKQT